jgi:hypothetical protein
MNLFTRKLISRKDKSVYKIRDDSSRRLTPEGSANGSEIRLDGTQQNRLPRPGNAPQLRRLRLLPSSHDRAGVRFPHIYGVFRQYAGVERVAVARI